MTTDLVKSISIDNLVNQRQAVRARLEQARAALGEADEVIRSIMAETTHGRLYAGVAQLVTRRGEGFSFRLLDDDGIKNAMRDFDGLAWRHLMQASGLRSLMDAKAREQWDKSLEKGEFPELTRENIEATFSGLYAARGDMFERGVIECFRRLSWDYKTNLPQKFGKRIVLRCVTGTYGNRACDELDDLVRVMHVLDGKPEPDHRRGTYAVLSAAGLTYANRCGVVEADYYSIRTFKNMNGHVTFKRLDLVERMNKIIAKHYPGALPAPK